MTLEDQLFEDIREGREVDIEKAALIVGGCDREDKVSEYKGKIDLLERRLDEYAPAGSARRIITNIHNLFWENGDPYTEARNFELADAIDAKQAEKPIGVCAILSALYASLALRKGLEVQALVMPEHVALRVLNGTRPIDIETTERYGVGRNEYSGIEGLPSLVIIASLLYNRGIAKYYMGNLKGAIEDYEKALEINPRHAGALNNRGIVKEEMGNPKGAIEDYTKALEINPRQADTIYNRGIIKEELGDLKGAKEDFARYQMLLQENHNDA